MKPKAMNKPVKCNTCKGSGRVLVKGRGFIDFMVCPSCINGSGYVEGENDNATKKSQR